MRDLRFVFLLSLSLVLGGCSALQSSGGRVTLLVVLPAVVIGVALFLLRRRAPRKGGGRGPRYPDYDDKE